MNLQARLLQAVQQKVDTRFTEGPVWECWEWQSTVNNEGYGVIKLAGQQFRAHRLVYELRRGDIPDGLVLDHLCRNVSCVNPDHLEPVTNEENVARGMSPHAVNARRRTCKQGHPLTADNTGIHRKSGHRYCRTCTRASNNRRMRALRARRRIEKEAASS